MKGGLGAMLVLAIVSAGTVAAAAAPVELPVVPQVPVPSVPEPAPLPVPAPAPLPEVAVPEVQVPAPAPEAPSLPSAPSLAPVEAPATAVSVGTRAVGPTVERTGRTLTTGAAGAFAPDARERRAQGRREARRREVRATIKRLRRKLRPVRECLHLLGRRSRRALVLHLGLGDARPRSRQAVARRLDTSWRHVRRLERRSFARMRRADRAGACGGAGPTAALVWLSGDPSASFAAVSSSASAPAGDAFPGRGDVRGERESGTAEDDPPGSGPPAGGDGREAPIGLVDSSTEDLQAMALILGVLLGAGVLVALIVARLRRPDRPLK